MKKLIALSLVAGVAVIAVSLYGRSYQSRIESYMTSIEKCVEQFENAPKEANPYTLSALRSFATEYESNVTRVKSRLPNEIAIKNYDFSIDTIQELYSFGKRLEDIGGNYKTLAAKAFEAAKSLNTKLPTDKRVAF